MLLESGILLLIYGGVRLFEKIGESHQKKVKPPKKELVKNTDNPNSHVIAASNPSSSNSYLSASYTSVGLASFRQFVPVPITVSLMSLGLYAYTFTPLLRESEKTLLHEHKFSGHVLDTLVVLAGLATNQYFAAAFVQMIYHLGSNIKAKTQNKSKNLLINIFEQQPSKVWALKNGVEVELPLESVDVSDILIINTGEIIPVDGIIIAGIATIDQHTLTGEAQPAEKAVGDKVFAATLVITGKLQIKIEKTGKETTVAKIGEILNNTTNYKTEVQLLGEKWSDQTAVPQLALTLLALPIIGPVSASAILNTNFGQRIKFLGSLDTLNHLNIAFHEGILIKDGCSLEQLISVDAIVFDKTGTLTQEQPKVGKIYTYATYDTNDILKYAATAEQKLSHPIAKAITQKAKQLNLTLANPEHSDYKMGYGITVKITNQTIKVGSRRFMELEGIALSEKILLTISNSYACGHSIVMVAIDQQIAGAIEIHAAVRPEIKRILAKLRQRKTKYLAIVSGDHQYPTQTLAEELGMDAYFYDILPENKAHIVKQLQQQGKTVCFIGDGVNDAIAMKQADVSISMSGASTVATDLAQIVLLDGTLTHLDKLFEIAEGLNKQLKKALFFGTAPLPINLAGIFLTHYGIAYTILVNQIFFWTGLRDAMLPLNQLTNSDKQMVQRLEHYETTTPHRIPTPRLSAPKENSL
jgi:Cu2+-exporting ATPase